MQLIVAGSLVRRTSLIRNTASFMNELVSTGVVSSVATVVVLVTIEQDLHREVRLGEGTSVRDSVPVREGGGRCEAPAGATIVGNVLVAAQRHHSSLSPIEACWKVRGAKASHFVWAWAGDVLSIVML